MNATRRQEILGLQRKLSELRLKNIDDMAKHRRVLRGVGERRDVGDTFENTDIVESAELASAELDRLTEESHRIDVALQNRNYGVCTECGEEIELKRLRALPYADACLACQDIRSGEFNAPDPNRRWTASRTDLGLLQ